MSSVPEIFDRALARRRLARALDGDPPRFLLARAAEDLADRLATIRRRFSAALDLGTPGSEAADALAPLVDGGVCRLGDVASPGLDRLVDDLEAPGLQPESHDLVVSLLALQTINDLPGLFVQVRRALKADGLFLAAMIGGASLTELRSCLLEAEEETTGGAAPRVSPLVDVRSLGQLLQRAGLALPVADSDVVTVRYPDALALMRDLRAMGAGNVLAASARRPLRRATLMRALDLYQQRFADADGRVRATFEIVWLSGWAPHESQQKPLKPGSAQMRLADALKVKDYEGPRE